MNEATTKPYLEDIDLERGEYLCLRCKAVYKVYGSRGLCDTCFTSKLRHRSGEELEHILEQWHKEDMESKC